MKKVLFFDVDGTLMINELGNNIIPKEVKEQIKRLKSLGHYLFIASGRPIGFLSKQITDAGFDGYVLCNGAHVQINDQLIYEKPIAYEDVLALTQFLDRIDCEYDYETASDCYIDKKFVKFDSFFRQCDINGDKLLHDFDLEDVMNRTLKIEISTDSCKEEIESYIKGKFRYDNHGTQNSFEICSNEVSKASGIKKVLDYLNVPRENSFAFGDGLNDLEMIEYAGHGIAMGNACQRLKEVADEVIGHVEENGLANYLKTIS